ncbi:MAG TPA: M23 family metallopeptidase [Bryobacteraceae bacterium]|nr:M23 family metallopeptidase [Bryobacteraceae bacterium]
MVVLLLLFPASLFFLSSKPAVEIVSPPKVIGMETSLEARAQSPHGLRRITGVIEQNGVRYPVFERTQPASRVLFWRHRQGPQQITFPVGRKITPALKDGKAKLILEVQANDLRALADSRQIEFEIISAPPKLASDGFQHYINQGGCELAVGTISGYWTEAGVRAGSYSFRTFPLPGSKGQERFSLFAFPWDLPAGTVPFFFAKNPGAETQARFWFKVFPKKFRTRDLNIDDAFLEKVVNQIDPGSTGDLLSRFLKINGEMRRKNNQTLADLRLKTADHFLWTKPFLQLANSKVESQFADKRSYIYKGKKVDEQVHLGFDLSVTQHVPVEAANDGQVVYASDLGIYGNCVVIDHGYGLQSIYGHLSSIDVKPGDMVKQKQSLGRSGSTGLAGGDHLHFSMQVDGVQVNPVEWWDDHWIKDRIRSKLQ